MKREDRVMQIVQSSVLCSAVAILLCGMPAQGAQIINNGGFESGFSNWTRVDQAGSDGSFLLQTGTLSPTTGATVPAPPGSTTAAMTDAQGPGTHVLYQDFTLTASVGSALLRFDTYLGNTAPSFSVPTSGGLDFSIAAFNQQARVDLLLASAPVFSVSNSDVLLNIFQARNGDSTTAYVSRSAELASILNANLNTPLRLRFAEVDNVAPFQFGVDAVSLETSAVPEPSALLMVGAGMVAGASRWAWRRKHPKQLPLS